jgi:hypothetical protein
MEFNGFVGTDFDFFKKKDKMLKDEYEKGRNDVKLHFRSFCYEIQKIYHKKTGGVFELDKEFQNFNKRSTSIYVDKAGEKDKFKLHMQMNSDFMNIEALFQPQNSGDIEYIVRVLKDNRNLLWDYAMASKYITVSADFQSKDKKVNTIKLTSLEINKKNYDSFLAAFESNAAFGKVLQRFSVGYCFSKNECVKQGKNFVNTAYDSVMGITNLVEQINGK